VLPASYTICITIRFEWGEQKDAAKQWSAALRFASAPLIFDDQWWHAIGAVQKAACWWSTYIEKENGEETIRIVPAREASQRERRIYIQQTAG
jgi:uncharacterized DUF497 family protein